MDRAGIDGRPPDQLQRAPQPGWPFPSNITDKATGRCFLPNGKLCDSRNRDPASKDQLFSFAAYSAVGTLEAEVVDVQYGTVKDLIRANTMTNATKRVALLKLGQAPFLYTLSLLTKAGFLGVLPYVDPCDVPERPGLGNKAFGISLNQEGDPSTPGYPSIEGSFQEHRPNLTSLLVQPVSASLAKELLSAPDSQGAHCVPLAASETAERKTIVLSIGTQAESRTVHNVIGYLKGATNPDRYVLVGGRHEGWRPGDMAEWSGGLAVMTQIIAALTGQSNGGWHPDRTTVFCSWGGSAFGNIGSFEWGEENGAVLQSRAVAYVGLHHPVRGRGALRPTASPSLLQLASDIHKKLSMNCSRARDCPVLNVSSVQMVGDVNFFANRLAIPTLEFTFPETRSGEKTGFLSEAFLPANSSAFETLDPSFKLHETVAKVTAEAILRLATDPVLPFMPLDIALDVQNKLRDDGSSWSALTSQAAALRDSAAFLQSEMMRPANDPKERDPPHLRMLNDVLRDLEKTFIVPDTPPGLYRNLLYCLNAAAPQFSILKDAREAGSPDCLNASLSLVLNAVNSARRLVKSGLDLFENDPNRSN
ncbi:hypothetical protein GJAV_G00072710 [Gymnothorax javanicus]|nr:hypothetical protein GJAV_G00072710 [Gymnothorax javanicus]